LNAPGGIVQGDRFSAFRPDSRDTAKDTSLKGTKIPIRPPGWHFASTFGHHPA
jgi:hypothetical protein